MLKKNEIEKIIKENAKAKSGEFYSRLYERVKKKPSLLEELERLKCKDKTELEMTLEG